MPIAITLTLVLLSSDVGNLTITVAELDVMFFRLTMALLLEGLINVAVTIGGVLKLYGLKLTVCSRVSDVPQQKESPVQSPVPRKAYKTMGYRQAYPLE